MDKPDGDASSSPSQPDAAFAVDTGGAGLEMDFEAMQRQIESLLAGEPEAPAHAEPAPEQATPVATTTDIRADALEAEPVDPLIKEIDAALADDADALLRGANGDIGEALRSVFDERALSGQEEEINRALIEAFGSSRVAAPSFSTPQITNPLPGFEGSARQISVETLHGERAASAEPAVQAPAAPDPAEPAAMVSPQVQAKRADETKSVVETVAPTQAPASETPMKQERTTANETTTTAAAPVRARRPLLELPVRALSAPMRAMPETARLVLSLAAITLALWTPVAWWLAHRATQTPAVAPIVIKPAPVVATAAAEPAKSDGGGSGH